MSTKIIITGMVILISLMTVSPAYADGGTVKPVCTEQHGFFARLFGQCVQLDSAQNTASQQGDTLGDTMTKDNPVSDNTESFLCKWNDDSNSNWVEICNK